MESLHTRVRAAGGWLFLVVLVALWAMEPVGSAPNAAAKKPASVKLVNTPAEPAVTREVGPVQPVAIQTALVLEDGSSSGSQDFNYVVPAGQRLVVQTVSAAIVAPPGQKVAAAVDPGQGESTLVVPTPSQGVFPQGEVHLHGGPLWFTVEPGETPAASLARSANGGQALLQLNLIGYLTPAL